MIWHIFLKDARLLWKAAVGVAALYVLKFAVPPHFAGPDRGSVPVMLSGLWAIAAALLVVVLVQTDALPALRQDWLVRPIRRRDLMLSKIVFLVLAIQGLIFVADLCRGLATGLDARLALASAFNQNCGWFGMALPLLAFATLTRSPTEALAAALATGLAVSLFMATAQNQAGAMNSAIYWIPMTAMCLCFLVAAGVVLWLQYYRRKTIASRWVFGVAAAAGLAIQLLPWTVAFAIEERFSTQPEAGAAIRVEPDLSRKAAIAGRVGSAAIMDVPLRFTGIRPGEILIDDRIDSRFLPLGRSVSALGRYGFEPGRSTHYQDDSTVVTIRRDLLPAGTARLELDYYFTLYRETARRSMDMNSFIRMDGMGVCSSKLPPEELIAEVDCRFGREAGFMKWSLEGISFHARSDDTTWRTDYNPWLRSGLTSRRATFRIADMSPVFGAQLRQQEAQELAGAHLLMKAYEPVAHFTRRLAIPVSQIVP